MLYYNGEFLLEYPELDNYRIISHVKNPKLNRYDCMTANGNLIKVLLRWKNGNGIALPAFQISSSK